MKLREASMKVTELLSFEVLVEEGSKEVLFVQVLERKFNRMIENMAKVGTHGVPRSNSTTI